MKRDKNWECSLSLSQKEYAGKYVVIAGGTRVGAGRDLSRLLKRARKDHPKETPFVARVRDPRKVCVYGAWAQTDDVPILLGRSDVFDRLAVTFSGRERRVAFTG